MPWTSVNTIQPKIFEDSSSGVSNVTAQTEGKSTLSIASRFRVNILAVATKLSKGSPKKRQSSGKTKKTTTQRPRVSISSIKKTPSTRKKTLGRSGEGTEINNTTSITSQTNNIEESCGSDDSKQDTNGDNVAESLENSNMGHVPARQDSYLPDRTQITAQGINASVAIPSTIIEISSNDESMDFDGFDFSEKDLDKELDPTTVSNLTDSSCNTADTSTDSVSSPIKSNGSPFPPFVHPVQNLELDTLNQATQRFTCFRAGELLQLAKRLRALRATIIPEPMIDFFATVREVCFADNTGQGQGVVFADIFFPGRPPFVAALSKTPYSVYDLKPRSPVLESSQGLVKATIVFRSLLPRVALGLTTQLRSENYVFNMSDIRNTSLEILEVHHSSWEEVREAKEMVEQDNRVIQTASQVQGQIFGTTDAYRLDLNDAAAEELIGEVDFSELEH